MTTQAVHIASADVANKNNRIYPRHVCEDIVAQANRRGVVMGTMTRMNHIKQAQELVDGLPLDKKDLQNVDDQRFIVNLEEVSHKLSNFRMEGDKLMADKMVMTTPRGKILRELEDSGIEMAYRLYGAVNLSLGKEAGDPLIVDKLHLVEIVALPADRAA